MTAADFKIGTRFRINGAGYRKTEIWQVIAIGDDGIEVVDERDLKFPEEGWCKIELVNGNLEYYSDRGFIEMLASRPSGAEVKEFIAKAEANIEDVPFRESINYDIADGVILTEKAA